MEKPGHWAELPHALRDEIPSLDAKFEVACTLKEQEFVSKKGG
jgi:hypothetical protein